MDWGRLKITSIVVVFFMYIIASSSKAAEGDLQWQNTFGGSSDDRGYSVQQTSDGGYIIAGQTHSYGLATGDVYLVKTDLDGEKLWEKTFGGSSIEQAQSVQQTSDDGYIITGHTYSYGAGNRDVYLLKTNSNGEVLWQKTFGGSDSDYGCSVQQTTDGGYIISGASSSYGAGSADVYLVKINPDGDLLWEKTFGGSGGDDGKSVQQTSDGGYIIAGSTASYGLGSYDIYLVKTNSSGDQLWQKTFGGSNYDEGCSVQQTSDGGYIIAGFTESYGSGSRDVYLVKTDSDGEKLWEKTFGGSNDDEGYSVQQTFDGGYVITGYTNSYGLGYDDVYLIKTNSDGEMLWQKTFGGFDYDYGSSVQQTTDGGYIISGASSSFGAGDRDVYLIKVSGDITSPTIHFASDVSAGDESAGPVMLAVTLSQAYSETVTVDYSVLGGIAIGNGVDYTLDSGTLTFVPGDISEDILLTIVDDALDETDETVIVTLSNPVNAGLGTNYIYTYTIIDDDDYTAGDLEWEKTFGGSYHEDGRSVQQTIDGGYIIAGYTYTISGHYDIYLVKTNSDGEMSWEQALDVKGYDYGLSVQQTSDGGYIIAGSCSGGIDVCLVKTNSDGEMQWHKIFGESGIDYSRSVQQTTDGGYIIVGSTESYGAGGYDVYLVKTDSNGEMLWQKTFGGSNNDDGGSVQQTSDGGYIIGGETNSYGAGDYDVYLVKTNSNGDLLWEKTFGGNGIDRGTSVQQTSDDGYVIAGVTTSYGASGDVYLVKTNSDGELLWQKTFGGSDSDYGCCVQQTTDSGYIIAGQTYSYGSGMDDVYLLKTNSHGDLQWQKTFGGSDQEFGYSVQQTSDGGYIIAGGTYSYGSGTAGMDDVYLIKVSGELTSIIGDFCGSGFGLPDGYVDVWDLMQFADHWHTSTGDANWDVKFDLSGPSFGNPDGYIDVWDLMTFADHWHEGEPP